MWPLLCSCSPPLAQKARPASLLSVEPVLFDLANVAATVAALAPLLRVADVVSPDWPAACALAGIAAADADAGRFRKSANASLMTRFALLLLVRAGKAVYAEAAERC